MTAAEIIPSVVDRIKRSLVGLKMPRAIEILDATVRRSNDLERVVVDTTVQEKAHGNPYDGHTLGPVIADLEKLTGVALRPIHGDKGYRGHNYPDRLAGYNFSLLLRWFEKLLRILSSILWRSLLPPRLA